jgi:hypothetical protein
MVPRASASHAVTWTVATTLLMLGPALAGQKPKSWGPEVDPANFIGGASNPYFPLVSGRTLLYRADTRDGTETLQIEVLGTGPTIMGVSTVEVIETATLNGQTIEIARNWFASDREGNVWYFGEATQDYDHGVPGSTAGSWQAGVNGALPGYIMKARPTKGDTYFQEFAPGIAQDMAMVMATGQNVTVPNASYSNVVVTKEWTPLEGNSTEHKYYAPGVGLILEVKGGDRMQLIEVR